MIDAQTRLRLADDITYQAMGPGQDTVILSLSSGYLFTCNQTTAAFIAALDGRRTLADVTAQLLSQFEVAEPELAADLLELANHLADEKIVVIEKAAGEGTN